MSCSNESKDLGNQMHDSITTAANDPEEAE